LKIQATFLSIFFEHDEWCFVAKQNMFVAESGEEELMTELMLIGTPMGYTMTMKLQNQQTCPTTNMMTETRKKVWPDFSMRKNWPGG
jgi:hypothetical protein